MRWAVRPSAASNWRLEHDRLDETVNWFVETSGEKSSHVRIRRLEAAPAGAGRERGPVPSRNIDAVEADTGRVAGRAALRRWGMLLLPSAIDVERSRHTQ